MNSEKTLNYLQLLPSVDEILQQKELINIITPNNRKTIVSIIRNTIQDYRQDILGEASKPSSMDKVIKVIIDNVIKKVNKQFSPGLRRVINASGVIIHTNLGRSLLSESALQAVNMAASNYSNLELNLDSGKRGSRYTPLEKIITEVTGAEAALVVNNNASAVLLALGTIANNKEVIVSRGQLIEIGGSFRIPDVMVQSGAELVEVGTTNKTYPNDYKNAITENTGLLLNVHTSNYRIVGFTRETTVSELVKLGKKEGVPVMSDLGSGSFVDLSQFGLPYEPTVAEIVKAGADLITFSGDKLLGGPQAGVIVGKKDIIEKMKKNPLNRAIRIDKFTVAALEATLNEYRDINSAVNKIPTLKMISNSPEELYTKAVDMLEKFNQENLTAAKFQLVKTVSKVGGGAMPTAELPSWGVEIIPQNSNPNEITSYLREEEPAVIARINDNSIILDMRTVKEDQTGDLFDVIRKSLS